MSYARFGASGSDVYVFPSVRGMECCACPIETARQQSVAAFVTRSLDEFEDHLAEHLAAGHNVPDYTVPAIQADAAWLAREGIAT